MLIDKSFSRRLKVCYANSTRNISIWGVKAERSQNMLTIYKIYMERTTLLKQLNLDRYRSESDFIGPSE